MYTDGKKPSQNQDDFENKEIRIKTQFHCSVNGQDIPHTWKKAFS